MIYNIEYYVYNIIDNYSPDTENLDIPPSLPPPSLPPSLPPSIHPSIPPSLIPSLSLPPSLPTPDPLSLRVKHACAPAPSCASTVVKTNLAAEAACACAVLCWRSNC